MRLPTRVLGAALAALQFGCASLVGGPTGDVGPPLDVGRVGLQVAAAPITVEFAGIPAGRGDAAGTQAGRFFAQCATAPGGGGGGSFVAAAYVLWLAGCAVATPVAAAIGASQAVGHDDVVTATGTIAYAPALKRLADELKQAVERAVNTSAPGRLAAVPPGIAQSELRLAVSKVLFSGDGQPDGPVSFRFTVDASVVRLADGAALRASRFSFVSEARRLREWSADGSVPVNAAVERAIPALAEAITESVFLLFPFPYAGQPSLETWFIGLQAEYPGRSGSFFDPQSPSVESLKPLFRWQAFPRDVDISADPLTMKRVEHVRYDLIVAEEENDAPAAVIYRRRALPSNMHEIETSLAPGKRYFWTVRPRFMLDGREYVSEWAERAPPTLLTPIRTRQSFTAPSPSSYRFKTPVARDSPRL